MAGELHEPGSVVAFWPDSPAGLQITAGVALVVVGRADIGWTVKTELRRVVYDSGRCRWDVVEPR